MSHVAQRRVAIRMLHDPAFAAAVRRDAGAALDGVDLTPAERCALAEVPPAAWRTDPDRPARVLAALCEEFSASVTLAPGHAAAFFTSRHFHDAVQERGSLALAFGAHMGEDADPRTVATAGLETAIAHVRRAPRVPAPSAPGYLRLSPWAHLVRTAGAATRLLAAARRGEPLPPLGASEERVLVVRQGDGSVTMEELTVELAGLLDAAARPRQRSALAAVAVAAGASGDEATGVLEGLAGSGILC